jgi:catechol 2,3-dioxygenase-like lactoylglutathione lyase family enzyme
MTEVASSLHSGRDVILRTEDFSAAEKFYGSVLGLPVVHRSETLLGFETGSFCLYVEKGKPHGPVFELLVPDVEATRDRLVAAGCTVEEEDASLPRCYLRDPYGLVFNLGRA